MENKVKSTLTVLRAHSLRELVEDVNSINQSSSPILKEDVVSVMKEDESYFLLYYR